VGGITYKVHSPQSRQSAGRGSNLGRRLFAEYTGMMQTGPHGPQGSNP
jgi:hypothetical protein